MFLLKKLISLLILPPLSPVLLVILGLLLLRRAPRLGRGLAWAGALIGLLLITPPLVRQLTLPLEAFDPPTAPALAQAQVVVVLGG
ncbi:MAG: YdcF family protein, partial [Zoogloea sp.]